MNLDHYREIAEGATPGPWVTDGGADGDVFTADVPTLAGEWLCGARPNDATFIATFNPEVVLALLEVVEAADAAFEGRLVRHAPSCRMRSDDVCERDVFAAALTKLHTLKGGK